LKRLVSLINIESEQVCRYHSDQKEILVVHIVGANDGPCNSTATAGIFTPCGKTRKI